jgi:tRNA(fMet)-specific endonuclease VapC
MTGKYIFDSNALTDLMNERYGFVERMKSLVTQGARFGTCSPINGEIWFGIELSKSSARNENLFKQTLRGLRIWPYGEAEARAYGRIHAALKLAGRLMQVPDMQLAAVALTLGDCTVVSTDTDLLAILGLQVENWRNS